MKKNKGLFKDIKKTSLPIFTKGFVAQGTIEYLVILAVVVVLALVVVGLIVGVFDSPSQQILDSSSKLGSATVGGISIVESVADLDGNSLVEVVNNSGDFIYLTKITLCDGVVNNYGEIGEQIVNGDSKLFSLSSSSCVGEGKSCEIKIEYTTRDGLNKSDSKEVTVTCVGSSTHNSGGGGRGPVNPIPTIIELGTLEHPWIINDCLELQDMNKHLDGNYELLGNVDCGSDTNNSSGSLWNSGSGFDPIGSDVANFTGTFNGNDYNIINLYIDRASENYVGLFGYAGTNAIIKNTGLVNSNLNGLSFVGSLVGYNKGIITDSYAQGRVIGNDTSGGNDAQAGMLVGTNYGGTIMRSSSKGYVGLTSGGLQVNRYYVGGLVGNFMGV